MTRVNFLYVDIKVYPASVEKGRHTGYDMDSILIADQPVQATHINLFDLLPGGEELESGIIKWINREIRQRSIELLHKDCPKAPGK